MAKLRPGFKHDGQFKPGNHANPRGRPRGSMSKTPRDVWKLLAERGDKDPLDVLSEFASSNAVAPELRIQAATALSGYRHGKRSALRWIEGITGLKTPTNVIEATAYVARIVQLMAEGRLDVDAGMALKDTLVAFIDARTATDVEERLHHTETLVAELMLRNANTVTEVIGGMPVMPGCEQVRMPHIGPPVIDQKPNPWAPPEAPDAAAVVDVTPRRRGRPRKPAKPEPGPQQPPDPRPES
jgi:hypothetical protein